jgi:hypothetical protein
MFTEFMILSRNLSQELYVIYNFYQGSKYEIRGKN